MTAEVYRHHVQLTITAGKAAMDQMFRNRGEDLGGQFGGQGQLFPVTSTFVGGRYRT